MRSPSTEPSGRRACGWLSRLLLVSLAAISTSVLGLAYAGPAAAGHHTCTLYAYAPVKREYSFQPGTFYIDFDPGTRAYCAAGTMGRLFFTAERHRWYGWSVLYEHSRVLNSNGDAFEGVWLDCPGPSISPGTWTFRSRGVLGVNHWYGWRYLDVIGPERRYNCY